MVLDQRSKPKDSRSKSTHQNYSPGGTVTRRKSTKKTQNPNKLDLNLWNAYFEKPL